LSTLSILCIGKDAGWKIRLRDALRETFYKPVIKQVSTPKQCFALLKSGQTFTALILRSDETPGQAETFLGALATLGIAKTPLILASLQGQHLTSSNVGTLYALGFHGIVAEPFSSAELLQMFGLAAERSKNDSQDVAVKQRAASFIIKDALVTIDEVARNLLQTKSGGRALVKLRQTSTTLRRFLNDLDPESIVDLLDKRIEKHLEDADYTVHNKRATVTIPKHPGKQLRSIMAERGLETGRLAALLKIEEQHLVAILDEQADVDEQLAIALSRVIGQAPDFWLGRKLAPRKF
jgi:hypothetical protein